MKNILSCLLISTFIFGISGCLKDKGFNDHKYGITDPAKQPQGVGFFEAYSAFTTKSISAINTPQTIQFPGLNLLAENKAPQDIHVNIAVDPSVIAAYNAANATSLNFVPITELPANAYTLSSLKVTIPTGQQNVVIPITFPDASVIDATKRYGLGLKIVSVDEPGYTVSSNLGQIIGVFPIKNIYEGEYTVDIVLVHPSAGGTYHEDATMFTTVNANTAQAYLAVLQVFAASSKLNITVNADNSLTLSSNATTLDPYNAALNYYDPATKTFHFNYGYSAGSRHITGTAVRNP